MKNKMRGLIQEKMDEWSCYRVLKMRMVMEWNGII
jgi:hypothetical protein